MNMLQMAKPSLDVFWRVLWLHYDCMMWWISVSRSFNSCAEYIDWTWFWHFFQIIHVYQHATDAQRSYFNSLKCMTLLVSANFNISFAGHAVKASGWHCWGTLQCSPTSQSAAGTAQLTSSWQRHGPGLLSLSVRRQHRGTWTEQSR